MTIGVYYESLCPDCQNFVTKQLYPASKKLGKYFKAALKPFGKAEVLILLDDSFCILSFLILFIIYRLMHIISLCSYVKIYSPHQMIQVGILDGILYASMVWLNVQETCIKPAFWVFQELHRINNLMLWIVSMATERHMMLSGWMMQRWRYV